MADRLVPVITMTGVGTADTVSVNGEDITDQVESIWLDEPETGETP